MKSYTYAIGWSHTGVWYYGVRYSSKMYIGDIWETYYTSSNAVKEYVNRHGEPDIIKVTRVFDKVEDGIDHEAKFLNRVNAVNNSKLLNCHNAPAFPWKPFDENPTSNPKVKAKIIRTKTTKALIRFVRNKQWEPSRGKVLIARIEKYIGFINDRKLPCRRIENLLRERLDSCHNYKCKPYPKNRSSKPRGKLPAISRSKVGKKAYYCPSTKVTKMFGPNDIVPENYVKGMIKITPNNNSAETRKKISKALIKSRKNESVEKRQQRLDKYHTTIIHKRRNK